MHPKNLHKNSYDFTQLVKSTPELKHFVINKEGRRPTIDFANSQAIKILNQALLKQYYKLSYWDIPDGYLCPPVPGRADYIHHIADLIAALSTNGSTNRTTTMGLDIGVGANVIYPIIGSQTYDWHFVGSDISDTSLQSATRIVANNIDLKKRISLRKQVNSSHIFKGLILPEDQFTFTMCNPPFHASAQDAKAGSQRKNRNLHKNKHKRQKINAPSYKANDTNLNFAGQHNELWCKGGETAFIRQMIIESRQYAKQVQWFTCLVSKKENLKAIYQQLEQVQASNVKAIGMSQGSKISRFIAWQF